MWSERLSDLRCHVSTFELIGGAEGGCRSRSRTPPKQRQVVFVQQEILERRLVPQEKTETMSAFV